LAKLSDISRGHDERAIAGLISGIYEAFGAGQVNRIEAALAEDCTIWDVFTPELIRGHEERARFHAADQAQMRARGPLTWRLGQPLVDVWGGDAAVARYLLEFEYQPPRALMGTVRITDVLRRIEGRWLIVHHHEGLVPTGPP
jgi:ketosteroid isomerase-like protein